MNQSVKPLPLRDGVSPSCIVFPVGPWPTVSAFLQAHFPQVSAATWAGRMARGEVVDADGARVEGQQPYRVGRQVYYYREVPDEVPLPFAETILHRDEHLVVVDKPHFLAVVPSGGYLQNTLLVRLKRRLQLPDLVPIHRLDRETAGVIILSHNPETRGVYQTLFLQQAMHKVYEAIAAPLPLHSFPLTYRSRIVDGEPFYLSQQVAGEANTETRIEVMEKRSDLWRYRLTPTSGRKHQLRVHMAALGAPILNDPFYPELLPPKGDDWSRPLQLLARSIAFTDPITGVARRFASGRELVWSGLYPGE